MSTVFPTDIMLKRMPAWMRFASSTRIAWKSKWWPVSSITKSANWCSMWIHPEMPSLNSRITSTNTEAEGASRSFYLSITPGWVSSESLDRIRIFCKPANALVPPQVQWIRRTLLRSHQMWSARIADTTPWHLLSQSGWICQQAKGGFPTMLCSFAAKHGCIATKRGKSIRPCEYVV